MIVYKSHKSQYILYIFCVFFFFMCNFELISASQVLKLYLFSISREVWDFSPAVQSAWLEPASSGRWRKCILWRFHIGFGIQSWWLSLNIERLVLHNWNLNKCEHKNVDCVG